MATILEALGNYLQAQSVGTLGTNLFLSTMPESPDFLIAVYETSGENPMFTMGAAATAIDRPSVQVLVRGARGDYVTARDTAYTIRGLLGALTNTTLSGVNVMRVEPQGWLLPLGDDENARPVISQNFDCMTRP